MESLSRDALMAAQGMTVTDSSGEKIGAIEDVYYDDATGRPEWIGIGTGIFGLRRRVVPVEGARLEAEHLSVPYAKDLVKDSPDVDDDEITPERESDLYAYYGLTSSGGVGTDARSEDAGGRIGSDLSAIPLNEAMGDVGGLGATTTSPRQNDDTAAVGAAAGDLGLRAPDLDLDAAADRQTGDDLTDRETTADGRTSPRESRLRRWSSDARETAPGASDARRAASDPSDETSRR